MVSDAHTLAATVAYNGAPFAGFARQPGLSTVQGELEDALSTLFRREVPTTCAGRTDAGVHALGQVVSFDVGAEELKGRSLSRLCRSINALTHDAISVRDLRQEAEGFSARFDAKSREYRYRIVLGETPPIFLAPYSWWIRNQGSLDSSAMAQAASLLIGEHDFKSFCLTASAEGKPTCRRILALDLLEEEHLGEKCLVVRVEGNAFLHSMVRTIVGTLVEVGCGHKSPEWVGEVLAARDRSAAGQTAPAQGLTFWKVTY